VRSGSTVSTIRRDPRLVKNEISGPAIQVAYQIARSVRTKQPQPRSRQDKR
jgi:hypothetical protein